MKNTTREHLINHYKNYPELQSEDIFKFIYQSSFGCEHMVTDVKTAAEYIKNEYSGISETNKAFCEPLDGEYSRVSLSWLNVGLLPETLAMLFCLSSKKEVDGKSSLVKKTAIAEELVLNHKIPIDSKIFREKLTAWRNSGYPAIHHSEAFRMAYKPSYRVIANRYSAFLAVFSEIDKLLLNGSAVIAIEGGSASGKSTLAKILSEVYDCNVFHTDDFFLRPEQRTPERFSEVGGNIDRERFYDEIVSSLNKNGTVYYRPFDCSSQTLGNEIAVYPKKLTVIEGVYSTHPAFHKYFDLSVFLDIDDSFQRKRISVRNSPALAERFFNEWILLENIYFDKTDIKNRSDIIISVSEKL